MKMETGVISVTEIIDSVTMNDSGLETLIVDHNNYMKLVTGAITAAGNIDISLPKKNVND